MNILLLSPQAAQLSIHFLLMKISSVEPLWGKHYWGIEREEKTQHPAGIEPTTPRVLLRRRALCCFSTTAALRINFHKKSCFQEKRPILNEITFSKSQIFILWRCSSNLTPPGEEEFRHFLEKNAMPGFWWDFSGSDQILDSQEHGKKLVSKPDWIFWWLSVEWINGSTLNTRVKEPRFESCSGLGFFPKWNRSNSGNVRNSFVLS